MQLRIGFEQLAARLDSFTYNPFPELIPVCPLTIRWSGPGDVGNQAIA